MEKLYSKLETKAEFLLFALRFLLWKRGQLNTAACQACRLCVHSAQIPLSYPILGQLYVLPSSDDDSSLYMHTVQTVW